MLTVVTQLTYLLQNSLSGNSKTLVSISALLLVEEGHGCADIGADVPKSFAAGGPPQRVPLFTAFRYQGKYTKKILDCRRRSCFTRNRSTTHRSELQKSKSRVPRELASQTVIVAVPHLVLATQPFLYFCFGIFILVLVCRIHDFR
jgi:hypothetical protein